MQLHILVLDKGFLTKSFIHVILSATDEQLFFLCGANRGKVTDAHLRIAHLDFLLCNSTRFFELFNNNMQM